MNDWEEKVWGQVMHIFESPHAAVSLLEIKAGFRCSVHHHIHRINQFTVTGGSIVVEEYSRVEGFPKTKHVHLHRGDVHIIPVGVWHCFRVLESGSVVENYWSANGEEVSIEDIIRIDIGGPDNWDIPVSPWSVV